MAPRAPSGPASCCPPVAKPAAPRARPARLNSPPILQVISPVRVCIRKLATTGGLIGCCCAICSGLAGSPTCTPVRGDGGDRGPLRRMLRCLLADQSNRPFTDLRAEALLPGFGHGSNPSQDGASWNPGAVQYGGPRAQSARARRRSPATPCARRFMRWNWRPASRQSRGAAGTACVACRPTRRRGTRATAV